MMNQKHQTNGIARYKNYKGEFLFPMKDFVSFVTDHQSMYFMSTIFLGKNIYGVRVPQFQLAYIRNTTNNPQKIN